ncbi:MAG: FAD-dependent oxidoreductase [Culicoidibacterales bacterium]
MMQTTDTIIIGSGLGGLSAALKLAQAGQKVVVLEQHFLAGGYATNFSRKTPSGERITFDASLHGIGGLLPGGNTRMMLTELGLDDQVTFIRKQETATLLLESGETFDIPDEFEAYKQSLQQRFPTEIENIERLFTFLDAFAKDMDAVYTNNQAPNYFAELQNQSLHAFLLTYTQDEQLIEVFSFLWLYYGLPNTELSALYYLLAWISYHIYGTFYIQGGAQALSDAYVAAIERLGGQVILREQVVACEYLDSRWQVTTKKGNHYLGLDLIFNGAPQPLLQTIKNPSSDVTNYLTQLNQLEVGISLTQLYIGLDCLPQTVGLVKADYFTHTFDSATNYEAVKTANYAQMDLGIVNYNLMDPNLNPKQGFNCLTIGDLLSNWPHDRRSLEYKAQKQVVTDQLLQRLYQRFPDVEGHITTIELATPVTMVRYTSNPGGAVYGFAQSVTQAGFDRPYVQTPIPHLYLASSWANPGGGYEGAIMSGLTCAKQLLQTQTQPKKAAAADTLMPVAAFMQGMVASFNPKTPFQARYQFAFSDCEPAAIIVDGETATFVAGTITDADVVITVSYPDWVAISNKTLAGEVALRTGRLKISGAMATFFKIPESFGNNNTTTAPEVALVKGSAFLPLALVPWICYWLTQAQLQPGSYLTFTLLWSVCLFGFIKPKVMRQPTTLELTTMALFGIILFLPPRFAPEILNFSFSAIWLLTAFFGESMTAQYSQYEYPQAMRTTTLFRQINRHLTVIWASIFCLQTLGVIFLPAPWHLLSYTLIGFGVVASIFYPKYKLGMIAFKK